MNAISPASAFNENKQEMMMGVQLGGPEQPNPAQDVNIRASFSNATVQNNNQPQGPAPVAPQANGMSNDDKTRLANDVQGISLNDPKQGMQAKQSDAMYLATSVGNALSEGMAGKGSILGILSDEHASNDKNGNGIPDDQEIGVQVAAAPPPQYNAGTSPGGPGGMG